MSKETLQTLNEEDLEIASQKAIRMLNIVLYIFIFSLVGVSGYSGYRAGKGTNLPWSVWIPPLFLGAIAISLAMRRMYKVKKEIANRTNNNQV